MPLKKLLGRQTKKKKLAKILYINSHLTQKEIAAQVGVTEATLSKWVNDPTEKWSVQKASFTITRQQELLRIYAQITALNTAIEERERGAQFPTNSEADILSKLSKAAKALETDTTVSEIINVAIGITEYIQAIDPIKAKEFSALLDGYISSKMSQL
jgi:transcriptional regulator with XRE-family HTH domain